MRDRGFSITAATQTALMRQASDRRAEREVLRLERELEAEFERRMGRVERNRVINGSLGVYEDDAVDDDEDEDEDEDVGSEDEDEGEDGDENGDENGGEVEGPGIPRLREEYLPLRGGALRTLRW